MHCSILMAFQSDSFKSEMKMALVAQVRFLVFPKPGSLEIAFYGVEICFF